MAPGVSLSREYPERPICSAAAVILKGQDVLLIQRGFAPRKGIWTFPGGAADTGETAREACAREVREETGLVVSVGPAIEVVDVMEPDGDRWRYHYTIIDFLAEVEPSSPPLLAGDDACDARWVPVNSISEYDLTPVALHVLERALWLRDNPGPAWEGSVRTIIGA